MPMLFTSMANGCARVRRSSAAVVLCLLVCTVSVASSDVSAQDAAQQPAASDVAPPAAPAFVPLQEATPSLQPAPPPSGAPSFAAPANVGEPGTALTPSAVPGAAATEAPPAATTESPSAQTTGDGRDTAPAADGAPASGAVEGASADVNSAAAPGGDAAAAPGSAPEASASQNQTLPHNLSPWGMFMAADIVVKAVMIGLAIASFATWTVWLAKAFELSVAKRRVRRAFKRIRTSASLGEALDAVRRLRGTGSYLVREAAEEMRASQALIDFGEGADGIKERVTSRLTRVEADAGRRLTRGTGILATIGATAPFVGLFGTVWGIMNSFIGIAETKTTNLAVVAPGIAEALLATAIGLVAAIPAVIIYNNFARSISGYRLELANTSALIERLVSRDLDLNRMQRERQQVAASGYQSAPAASSAPHAPSANLGAPVAGAGTAFAAE